MCGASHRLLIAARGGGRVFNSYLVFFQCPTHVVETGGARFRIEEGTYVYVGSCGPACLRRVMRHLARPAARRWHVDYLQCAALYAAVGERPEREVALCLSERCPYVEGFGSSDDPHAPSHLFKCGAAEALRCLA
ncbi:MAG: DUF123 domain-containing protein [Pyrobaculum sp.]